MIYLHFQPRNAVRGVQVTKHINNRHSWLECIFGVKIFGVKWRLAVKENDVSH